MSFTFDLRSYAGIDLTGLYNGDGRKVTKRRNQPREFTFTLSHKDTEAKELLDALANGLPQLIVREKVGSGKQLRFAGVWAPRMEEQGDTETSRLTCVFRDPLHLLDYRFTGEIEDHPGEDAGTVIKNQVDRANTESSVLIATSAAFVEATVTMDVTYEHKNRGEAIREATELAGGPDVYIDPRDDPTTLGDLHVVRQQGQERPDAKFEHGPSTLANCRSATRTTSPPRNKVTVIGAEGVFQTVSDSTSISKYGVFAHQDSLSDVIDADVLQARAQELLRPSPIRVVTVEPDPRLAPQPFVDYDVGDTIPYLIRKGRHGDVFAWDASGQSRIDMIEVELDSDGKPTAHRIEFVEEDS